MTLTREDIYSLTHEQLNKHVSELVLNLEWIDERTYFSGLNTLHMERSHAFDPELGEPWYDFYPATDMKSAFEVLTYLINKGAEVNVGFYKEWDCSIDYPIGTNWRATGETAPLAISRCALLAVIE